MTIQLDPPTNTLIFNNAQYVLSEIEFRELEKRNRMCNTYETIMYVLMLVNEMVPNNGSN